MFLVRGNLLIITGYILANVTCTNAEKLFSLPKNLMTLTENRIPTSTPTINNIIFCIFNDTGGSFQNASASSITTSGQGYFHFSCPVRVV